MTSSKLHPIIFRSAAADIVRLNLLDEVLGDVGCTPRKAAELLSAARLDRQVELSRTLSMWFKPPTENEQDGRLILAWVNLGALVEGALKWFLCVFGHDYATAVFGVFPVAGGAFPRPPAEPLLTIGWIGLSGSWKSTVKSWRRDLPILVRSGANLKKAHFSIATSDTSLNWT